ncbi:MAG TPA: TonB-dependent receptor plug domain-containing protein [Flavobacterium sp.]|nr:TonB-dependent receptor plug domain-containing protein [Flavobacterium sp.]HPJ09052.1 TonB-dependent receptor plug domain-containing protein [Flavobacterium sp.]
MSKGRIYLILAFFFFLFPGVVLAQQKAALKTALSQIEKQHQVKFSYTEETIASYEVAMPDASQTLLQQLEQLQKQTPLGFEIVDNRYVIVTVSQSVANDAKADAMTFSLNEVTIDHYLTSGISKTKSKGYVLKPSKFGILPGLIEPDVLQTMQQIPGIYSAEENISSLNVRGGTHDQNLFLWNGIRMFQTGHFFGLISAFNPALPNRILIAKNGTSAFYGESVSSVVDMATTSEKIEPSAYAVGLNLIAADFYAKMKLNDKASLMVSGRRSHTDWVQSPTYQKYYNRIFQNTIVTNVNNREVISYNTNEDFYFYDFTMQFKQKIGTRHELLVDGIGISNRLGVDQRSVVAGQYNSKNSLLEQQSYGGNLSWKTNWNAKNTTQINAYVSWYDLESTNQSIEKNQLLNQENSVLDTGIRIENSHELSPFFIFKNGYQYNEIGISNFDEINNPEFSRNVRSVLHSHALVLETQIRSRNGKLSVNSGIRSNYYENFDKLLIEPRLQFNYAMTQSLAIELLGEMKNQTASQVIDLQQDFMGIEKRRWTLADDREIPIQKSQQLALGITYKNRRWLFTIDNFYKKVAGISTPGQAFRNQLERIKLNGNYEVWGSEVLLQRNFRRFYTWLAYSFNHNRYDFSQYDPSRFPNNFQIEHSLSGAATYDWKKLRIALGGKWNSGRPTTTPVFLSNRQISYNTPNNEVLDDFFQFNLSGSYEWLLGQKTRLQVHASLLNIFNKSNTVNRYYRVNSLSNTIESVNTYALERTPNLSLRLLY